MFFSNNICSGFVSLTVKNVTSLTSSQWIKQKLSSAGIKPKNTLEDFRKYILLKTKHPLEISSLDKIYLKTNNDSFNLNLVKLENQKKFNLNKKLIDVLDKFLLVIKANEFPIGIAGIIPDQKLRCSNI